MTHVGDWSRAAAAIPSPVRDRLRFIRNRVRGMMSPGKLRKAVARCHANNRPIRIILGAGRSSYDQWIATDVDALNICRPDDWAAYFAPGSVDAILSEHVLEHLSVEENRVALKSALKYLKPGGRFRIAVPDGNRRDAYYRAAVAPPVDGHKVIFNLQSLTALLGETGFVVRPLEYLDDKEEFHTVEWNSEDGHISRSARHDRQENFKKGEFYYTSLIVDAFKPR
jgi:predicted SAM-dependent methyltransferase